MWHHNITFLKGIGAETARKLGMLGIHRVIDAALYAPTKVISRTMAEDSALFTEAEVILALTNPTLHYRSSHQMLSRKSPLKIKAESCWGPVEILYFRGRVSFYAPHYRESDTTYVLARMVKQGKKISLIHPQVIRYEDLAYYRNQPIYPLTYGITQAMLRKIIMQACAITSKTLNMAEHIPAPLISKYNWPSFVEACGAIHSPHINQDLAERSLQRLAFDEMLAYMAEFSLQESQRLQRLAPCHTRRRLAQTLLDNLPFALTNDQKHAIEEVSVDMASSRPMLRLLQGDVGSGKTIVALHALVLAVENGFIGCIMAPTEILAKQHMRTMQTFTKGLEVQIFCLTSKTSAQEKRSMLDFIASGKPCICIGTHALLFQQPELFARLSCLIIDEQHRFGVEQRLRLLGNKMMTAHCLLMSATPIPRTQRLMQFGQITVSELREKPSARKPIVTTLLPRNRVEEFVGRLRVKLQQNHKAYWVCPLIEESEGLEAQDATNRFHELKQHMPDVGVELIHGRTHAAERDGALKRFKEGTTRLLVSTTVIEVGIDVPDATILIIENAERFGLSQLHQLRGRVGRGDLESYCILIFDKLSQVAQERLNIMRTSNDGFAIAEADLHLRDAGNILGTQQSGKHLFRFYNPEKHQDLLDDLTTTLNQISPSNHETVSQIFLPKAPLTAITAAG